MVLLSDLRALSALEEAATLGVQKKKVQDGLDGSDSSSTPSEIDEETYREALENDKEVNPAPRPQQPAAARLVVESRCIRQSSV